MLRILHLLLRSGEGTWLLALCVLQCSVLNSIKLVKVTVPGMINLLLVKKTFSLSWKEPNKMTDLTNYLQCLLYLHYDWCLYHIFLGFLFELILEVILNSEFNILLFSGFTKVSSSKSLKRKFSSKSETKTGLLMFKTRRHL